MASAPHSTEPDVFADGAAAAPAVAVPGPSRGRRARHVTAAGVSGLRALAIRYRWALAAYLLSRVLLVGVVLVNDLVSHHSLLYQLVQWDGTWYGRLAAYGYPAHALLGRSTLGFFPLYPLLVRGVAAPLQLLSGQGLWWSVAMAGGLVSTLGGLIAAVLVQALAQRWWDGAAARRAVLLFCLFPGSVVFSMVYAEGLMLPLVAGCLLALQTRRWWTAGGLAALATATEPEAVVLIVVCGLAAARELRRAGLSAPQARRSLAAPLLSGLGVGAFAVFLWAWTGTPLATLHAQRTGWQEKSDPLALVHLARSLADQISFAHFNHPTINLNLVVGLAGAVVLAGLLVLVWRARRSMSPEAILWTLGISVLAVTSEYVPPNPRLLITAFPAIMAAGRYLRGRGFVLVAGVSGALLVVLSALTYVATTLRP